MTPNSHSQDLSTHSYRSIRCYSYKRVMVMRELVWSAGTLLEHSTRDYLTQRSTWFEDWGFLEPRF